MSYVEIAPEYLIITLLVCRVHSDTGCEFENFKLAGFERYECIFVSLRNAVPATLVKRMFVLSLGNLGEETSEKETERVK